MPNAYRKNGADLQFVHAEKGVLLTVPAHESLGILRDGDVLIKHGPAGRIKALAEQYRDRIVGAGVGIRRENIGFEVVEVPVTAITPAVLEEINACLQITGRVGRLPERLQEIARTEGGGPLCLAMMPSPSPFTH